MNTQETAIRYLRTCRELAEVCTQGGWIDNDSLEVDVTASDTEGVLVAVCFDEIVMKGAGCEGRRIPCFGQLRLTRNEQGEIVSGVVL